MINKAVFLVLLSGIACVSTNWVFLNVPINIVELVRYDSSFTFDCSNNGKNIRTSLCKLSGQTTWVELKPDGVNLLVNRDKFTLNKFNVNHVGQYKCKGTDPQGGNKFWPSMLILLPELYYLSVSPEGPLKAQVNDKIQVTCQIKTRPSDLRSYSLEWRFKRANHAEKVVQASRITQSTYKDKKQLHLFINQVGMDDDGKYTCILKGKNAKRTVSLTVLPSHFRFIAKTPDTAVAYVRMGRTHQMYCSTNDPNAIIKLLYRPMYSLKQWSNLNSSLYSMKGGIVSIPIHTKTVGFYKCVATNPKGSKIQWPDQNGILLIPYIPKSATFTITPVSPSKGHNLRVGDKLVLECSSDIMFEPQWSKAGPRNTRIALPQALISTQIRQNRRHLILSKWNVRKVDAGVYICSMKHAKNPHWEKSFAIRVDERFQFLKSQAKLNVRGVVFNESEVIDCSTNDPNAVSFLYIKDYESYHNNKVKKGEEKWIRAKRPRKTGNVYNIINFTIKDAGRYKCVATNKRGVTIEHQIHLVVNLNLLPDITISPLTKQTLFTGQRLKITCEIPTTLPRLTWERKEPGRSKVFKPVPSNLIVTEQHNNKKTWKRLVLEFPSASLSDAGLYRCKMTYRKKYDFQSIGVDVVDKKQKKKRTQPASKG